MTEKAFCLADIFPPNKKWFLCVLRVSVVKSVFCTRTHLDTMLATVTWLKRQSNSTL
jgi:hypothetical protein